MDITLATVGTGEPAFSRPRSPPPSDAGAHSGPGRGEPVPSETWVIWVVLAFEGVVGVAAIAMMFGWYKTSTSAMKERLERVESRQDTGEHRLTGFATREDLQGLREEIQEVKTGNARLDEKLDKLLDVMGARHV